MGLEKGVEVGGGRGRVGGWVEGEEGGGIFWEEAVRRRGGGGGGGGEREGVELGL